MALNNVRVNVDTDPSGAVRGFDKAEKAMKKFGRAQKSMSNVSRSMNRGLTHNRRVIQQLGFQVSDFSVQMAGGQSAILAFTQNVPQVVQMFGMFGGVLAGVISVLGTLVFMASRSGQSFEDMAAKVGLTAQQFEMIKNTISGVGTFFVEAINLIINKFDVLMFATIAYVTYLNKPWKMSFFGAVAVVRGLTSALLTLGKIMMRLGFTAIFLAIGYLIERIFALNSVVKDWGKTFGLVFTAIGEAFQNLPNLFLGAAAKLTKYVLLAASGIIEGFQNIVAPIKDVVNLVIGLFVGAFNSIVEVFSNLPAVMGEIFEKIPDIAEAAAKGSANWFIDAYNDIGALKAATGVDGLKQSVVDRFEFTPIELESIRRSGENVGKTFTDSLNFDYIGGMDVLQENLKGAADLVDHFGNNALDAATKNMPAWQEINRLLGEVKENAFDIRNIFPDGGDKTDPKFDEKTLKKMRKELVDGSIDIGKGVFDRVKSLPEAVSESIKKATFDIKEFSKDAGKSVEEIWEKAGDATKAIKQAAGEITGTFKESFKSMLTGAKSFKDAMIDILEKIQDKLLDLLLDPLFNSIAGGVGKGIESIFKPGSVFGTPTVPSYSGGGRTWSGPRAGGLDGKGGQLAMLHPNETVIDHVANSGRSGTTGKNVTIINENYFNGVTYDEVMRDVELKDQETMRQVERELPGQIQQYQFNRGRGM